MAVTSGGLHGGARRSARIERQAEEILALVRATPDFTLAEIADHLFKAHDDRFVPSVIWRFFDRRNVTFKNIARQQRRLHDQSRPWSALSPSPLLPSLTKNA
jgi:hypothetical protein